MTRYVIFLCTNTDYASNKICYMIQVHIRTRQFINYFKADIIVHFIKVLGQIFKNIICNNLIIIMIIHWTPQNSVLKICNIPVKNWSIFFRKIHSLVNSKLFCGCNCQYNNILNTNFTLYGNSFKLLSEKELYSLYRTIAILL